MKQLVLDLESRSQSNLKKVGSYCYAADPSTEVLCAAYAVDNAAVQLWLPDQPVPKAIHEAIRSRSKIICHNVNFEKQMWREILTPRFGWPVPHPEQWIDTLALAYASALPGALEKVTTALNLKHRKQTIGARVMLQVSQPRKARKNEAPGIYWYDDDERMQKLYLYCIADVEAERELYHVLEPLSEQETAVWLLDQRINDLGFCIDVKLARAARDIATKVFQQLDEEMLELTDGRVGSINEVAKLKEWLGDQGVLDIESLNKAAIGELLSHNELPVKIRRAIELRQLGAQAAVKKVDAFLQRINGDDRIRGGFQYHAAGPGRWAGRGAQIQNLKRTDENLDVGRAVEIIGSGDYKRVVKEYKAPLATIGNIIRAMICARPGHVLIGADFSGIEARVTAWLADEYSKLDVFRKFDVGLGPDPYVAAAMKVFRKSADQIIKEERQVGKAAELAFGFGGGLGAFRRFDPSPSGKAKSSAGGFHDQIGGGSQVNEAIVELTGGFTDAQIHDIKNAWRRAHPNIVAMWRGLYESMETAIKHRSEAEVTYDKIKFFCDDYFLWMTLPSGRRIAYPQAGFGYELKYGGRIVREEDAHEYTINQFVLDWDFEPRRVVTWKDNSKGWQDVKGWPGLPVENAVQGIARDLLAEAMLRIDAAGLPIVAHVHNSIVIEIPEKDAKKVIDKFIHLMCYCPDWAKGLPIVAKAWTGAQFE